MKSGKNCQLIYNIHNNIAKHVIYGNRVLIELIIWQSFQRIQSN